MYRTSRTGWLVLVAIVVTLGVLGLFVVETESASPEAAAFDDTVSVGLALDEEYGLGDDVELPRVQVFYSQYEYVVGYYGVETFVDAQRAAGHEQQFGYPLAAKVTDYSTVDVELNADGHPTADREPDWTDAETAWFVYGSDARSPSGETVVPFGDREDADAFAESHGGTVLDWEALFEQSYDLDDATVVRDRVDDRHRGADEVVAQSDALLERPVSTVVGEDADTVQEAIDAAPANTTVVVPDGTYEETLEIDRPITLVGQGDATIHGDGDGTVITVTADHTALSGLEVTGAGTETDGVPGDDDSDGDEWDDDFVQHIGGGDAAIGAVDADGLLITDVEIDTPSNGVIVRGVEEMAIRNLTVVGTESWEDGFGGVVSIHSDGVIEGSTFVDGRDGVYTHRSDGIVIRDNAFEDNRLGIHLMHTSEVLIAGNDLRGQENTGIYEMTGPERNAIVDNEVRDVAIGVAIGGSNQYVAGNVFEGNDVGLNTRAHASIVERNVFVDNGDGLSERSMLPTNRVVGNDFVGNEDHADVGTGPLRIWTHGDQGNYWQGAVGASDGSVIDRPYSPTHAVDGRLHDTDGTPTLARAPALDALAGLQGTVPGMRDGSAVDLAPTVEPNNPDLLERTDWDDYVTNYEETTTDDS